MVRMIIRIHGVNELVTPSVEDIMKARLKTVGVEEYHFVMENGPFRFPRHPNFIR
jgi:hypothetical protein